MVREIGTAQEIQFLTDFDRNVGSKQIDAHNAVSRRNVWKEKKNASLPTCQSRHPASSKSYLTCFQALSHGPTRCLYNYEAVLIYTRPIRILAPFQRTPFEWIQHQKERKKIVTKKR